MEHSSAEREAPDSSSDIDDQRSIEMNRLLLSGLCLPSLVHELNNPLHVIAATAELMLGDPGLPAHLPAKIDRMFAHANRASRALLEYGSFFRTSADADQEVDLATLVEQVLAMRRVALKRGTVTLSFARPRAQALVFVRPLEITQVLMNLVVNAEAAAAATEGGTIEVSVETSADLHRCTIVDSGVTIDSASHPRATDVDGGRGLRAASLLAQRNGGTLRIEDVTSGARFVLELPGKPL